MIGVLSNKCPLLPAKWQHFLMMRSFRFLDKVAMQLDVVPSLKSCDTHIFIKIRELRPIFGIACIAILCCKLITASLHMDMVFGELESWVVAHKPLKSFRHVSLPSIFFCFSQSFIQT
jgi:hypothetical protein